MCPAGSNLTQVGLFEGKKGSPGAISVQMEREIVGPVWGLGCLKEFFLY